MEVRPKGYREVFSVGDMNYGILEFMYIKPTVNEITERFAVNNCYITPT